MADPAKSSPALILAAWAVVVLPATWGLNYTIKNALKIFAKASVAAASSPLTR